jgi:hypothetical protein
MASEDYCDRCRLLFSPQGITQACTSEGFLHSRLNEQNMLEHSEMCSLCRHISNTLHSDSDWPECFLSPKDPLQVCVKATDIHGFSALEEGPVYKLGFYVCAPTEVEEVGTPADSMKRPQYFSIPVAEDGTSGVRSIMQRLTPPAC